MKAPIYTTLLLILLTIPASWLTHVWVTLLTGQWGFLIAGAIFPPIGIVHGFMLWLGVA